MTAPGNPPAMVTDDDVPGDPGISSFVSSQLATGREAAGTGGEADRRGLFRVLRESGLSSYPLFAMLALTVSDSLSGGAASILAPDISRTFGLTPQFFTTLALFGQVLSFVIPLAVARSVQNKPRRALVLLSTQIAWCLFTGVYGVVTSVFALGLVSVLDRASSAASGTVSTPLLIDLYPPVVRVRVMAFLASAGIITGLISTAAIAGLTGPLNLTWRGVFLVLGAVSLLAVLFALRLRDPGYGTHDTQVVRERARDALAEELGDVAPSIAAPAPEATKLTLLEALRRIWTIRSMRIMLLAGMVGALPAPTAVYLQFFFTNHFALTTADRALMSLAGGLVALGSLIVLAPIGDTIFQRSPKRLFYLSGALGILGQILFLGQLVVTTIPALVAFFVASSLFVGLTGPAIMVGMQSIVPAPLRPHAGALAGMFALFGVAVGTALLGGLTTSLGIPGAIAVVTTIGSAATLMTAWSGRYVRADLDAVITEVTEEEFVAHKAATGRPMPMLMVRGVEYHYGPTQVLFGVDLEVADGELIALLGVNGAGKSTLLRAITGLGVPSAGSIRLAGQDITFLDAERRTKLGITQVPGGRSVFGDLSVLDNLRCYSFGLPAAERRAAHARIEEALAHFPNLERRRHLPAGALSGGEQQMLGLARAFVLRPRLLLIDELSLGLAPKVVGELLETVRAINAAGTAVILVEQSVNVALSVAERAVFMERGEVRFDGPTADLRNDASLLRSIFLTGSAS